jgi:hypothetical protein
MKKGERETEKWRKRERKKGTRKIEGATNIFKEIKRERNRSMNKERRTGKIEGTMTKYQNETTYWYELTL